MRRTATKYNKLEWLLGALGTVCVAAVLLLSVGRGHKPPLNQTTSPENTTTKAIATTNPAPLVLILPHAHMEQSTSPELRATASYETIIGEAVKEAMVFTSVPTTDEAARSQAVSMVGSLQEFKKFGITPLVILEPLAGDQLLPPEAFATGQFDQALETYYAALRQNGVDDQAMGMWVFFPEANTPEFGLNTDPQLFAANVTRLARLQKKHFPGSKVSILLDSLSYQSGDTAWDTGNHNSLEPYVRDIPKGLVDSFGLQGLPWTSPANNPEQIAKFDPHDYLAPYLATKPADSLGVRDIWFNTGTFSRIHAGNQAEEVRQSPEQRAAVLDRVATVAGDIRKQGYSARVNIFAGNKAHLPEGTDWSYMATPADQRALRDFVAQLNRLGVNFSLFDRATD